MLWLQIASQIGIAIFTFVVQMQVPNHLYVPEIVGLFIDAAAPHLVYIAEEVKLSFRSTHPTLPAYPTWHLIPSSTTGVCKDIILWTPTAVAVPVELHPPAVATPFVASSSVPTISTSTPTFTQASTIGDAWPETLTWDDDAIDLDNHFCPAYLASMVHTCYLRPIHIVAVAVTVAMVWGVYALIKISNTQRNEKMASTHSGLWRYTQGNIVAKLVGIVYGGAPSRSRKSSLDRDDASPTVPCASADHDPVPTVLPHAHQCDVSESMAAHVEQRTAALVAHGSNSTPVSSKSSWAPSRIALMPEEASMARTAYACERYAKVCAEAIKIMEYHSARPALLRDAMVSEREGFLAFVEQEVQRAVGVQAQWEDRCAELTRTYAAMTARQTEVNWTLALLKSTRARLDLERAAMRKEHEQRVRVREQVEHKRALIESECLEAEKKRKEATWRRMRAIVERKELEEQCETSDKERFQHEAARAQAEEERAKAEQTRAEAVAKRIQLEERREMLEKRHARIKAARMQAEEERLEAERRHVQAMADRVALGKRREMLEKEHARLEAERMHLEAKRRRDQEAQAEKARHVQDQVVHTEEKVLCERGVHTTHAEHRDAQTGRGGLCEDGMQTDGTQGVREQDVQADAADHLCHNEAQTDPEEAQIDQAGSAREQGVETQQEELLRESHEHMHHDVHGRHHSETEQIQEGSIEGEQQAQADGRDSWGTQDSQDTKPVEQAGLVGSVEQVIQPVQDAPAQHGESSGHGFTLDCAPPRQPTPPASPWLQDHQQAVQAAQVSPLQVVVRAPSPDNSATAEEQPSPPSPVAAANPVDTPSPDFNAALTLLGLSGQPQAQDVPNVQVENGGNTGQDGQQQVDDVNMDAMPQLQGGYQPTLDSSYYQPMPPQSWQGPSSTAGPYGYQWAAQSLPPAAATDQQFMEYEPAPPPPTASLMLNQASSSSRYVAPDVVTSHYAAPRTGQAPVSPPIAPGPEILEFFQNWLAANGPQDLQGGQEMHAEDGDHHAEDAQSQDDELEVDLGYDDDDDDYSATAYSAASDASEGDGSEDDDSEGDDSEDDDSEGSTEEGDSDEDHPSRPVAPLPSRSRRIQGQQETAQFLLMGHPAGQPPLAGQSNASPVAWGAEVDFAIPQPTYGPPQPWGAPMLIQHDPSPAASMSTPPSRPDEHVQRGHPGAAESNDVPTAAPIEQRPLSLHDLMMAEAAARQTPRSSPEGPETEEPAQYPPGEDQESRQM
ncbi:hypothetical protein POSPLADRAFT_1153921 [Postia placenta MAD-698-R-SB12]|uniref:Uncharacterized protein n=1 Tax=Postia placenta MAD-698-R-SB12 TaxID=670580 RepID=A0A1X6MP55_9APHY|nr:hypothetical protein POSPLADRAFT_1153921 [Postia placenta MAD-698-R-SB12]OSX58118.1 hypothetical protein POSPLADRAFT_1153921 [Postia placenta MAD-698-R-SB12]